MEKFRKKTIKKENIPSTDKGIKVQDLIKLVERNEFTNKLLNLLDFESIKDEFIEIKGATTLFNIQNSINTRYKKEDLKSELNNISLFNNKDFSINFYNINDNEYFSDLKLNKISTTPIYSAQRDFFSGLFQMDKYATRLINKGYKEIVETNLQLLKGITQTIKKYRILHDKVENIFYLRAIISLNNYFNYDNNIAIVVGLLTLHNEMKKSKITYGLQLCEYNESFIRMFFESSEVNKLEKVGNVKNIIEVSNDEIKREALKFSGICSIIFKHKDIEKELFIKPQEIKSKILSIKHNQIPKTAIEELGNIENSEKVHKNLFEDISKIATIKDPEQIKFLVKRKVEKAKSEEIKRYRAEILRELNHNVSNLIELLNVFKKIELLANEDIETTEYLRFLMYQALVERR
ncbi:hypothetical protein [Flavobacterium sp. HJSW_4]|uniref:hypothetical protein n=1 Tax=Flavobacterium sp. HJSW_4 TaxID=3344660 RepID=UPI0035F37215